MLPAARLPSNSKNMAVWEADGFCLSVVWLLADHETLYQSPLCVPDLPAVKWNSFEENIILSVQTLTLPSKLHSSRLMGAASPLGKHVLVTRKENK